MKTEKKLGIWMDHLNAHIIEFSSDVKDTQTITSDLRIKIKKKLCNVAKVKCTTKNSTNKQRIIKR